MEKKDRERYEKVAKVLDNIDIRDFLLIGLRRTKSCKDNEMESFYCLSGGDRMDIVASLRNVFLNNPDLGGFLISILHETYHTAMIEGAITDALANPIARA